MLLTLLGISFKGLWELANPFVELKTERIKKFVYDSLLASSDVVLLHNGKSVAPLTYDDAVAEEPSLELAITEDKLWTVLTGYNKKESAIGGLAFELLMEVAKRREHGVNTMDLATITKQDPRSITGRIKKLGNLVTGVQIIYKGHVVKLIKFYKFADEKPRRLYVNMRQYLPNIVETVKKSKNGVRQVVDLKRELKFDKDKRLNKAFIAAIAWLDEKKYLKKVLVVSPSNPETKIRCVQYLRDYITEERDGADFENDSTDDGEEEDDDAIEGFDNGNATGLLQETNLLIQDNTISAKEFSMNRFFPLQNQTYALAEKRGTQGVSTMECVNTIVGSDYRRSFTKNSEYYLQTIGKSIPKNAHNLGFNLVRVYDFEGKKKFYRLFTEHNFRLFSGSTDQAPTITIPHIHGQKSSLSKLSEANFMPLNATLRFTNKDDQEVFFWHGELDIPATSTTTARGRKRKSLQQANVRTPKKKKPSVEANLIDLESTNTTAEHAVIEEGAGEHEKLVCIGGFTANSLKSIQRQKAILDIVRKYGGVTYVRDQLYEDVSKYLGTKMILDKKTLRGDVELLVAANKLKVNVKPNGRRVLYLPSMDGEQIERYLNSVRDTKVAFSKDIIKNTDIYFFDQTEHNRFHRGTKSAERVKAFQNKSKRADKKSTTGAVKNTINTKPRRVRTKKRPASTGPVAKNGMKPEPTEKNALPKKRSSKSTSKSAETFNVSTKEGNRVLIMAAVITKSIKGQTLWPEIAHLFPNNSVEHLKKQCTLRRVKMGHSGWRALMEKWRKIMVNAVRNERATLEDAEQLNLVKLVHLWMAEDDVGDRQPLKLYKDYEENHRRYTLIKNNQRASVHVSLAMSSMIQRESYLLKKTYTYSAQKSGYYNPVEEEIRSVVRSILISNSSIETDDIGILKAFNSEQVDKVILDMARERHISFVGSSKLQLTDVVLDLLNMKGKYWELQKAARFKNKVLQLLNSEKALAIGEEPSNHSMPVLLDMLECGVIDMTTVPLAVKENSMYYATRKYEVTALTPPLIFFAKKKLVEPKLPFDAVPRGQPCSRLWVDPQGKINEQVWKQLVFMTIHEILFNPGITLATLTKRFRKLVSHREMEDIVQWLKNLALLDETSFDGFIIKSDWYLALGS